MTSRATLLLALAASSAVAFNLQPVPNRATLRAPAVRRSACAPLCCEEEAQTAWARRRPAPEPREQPPLNVTTVAELLEASFVRACIDLSTGLVDTLKLFIVAAKA